MFRMCVCVCIYIYIYIDIYIYISNAQADDTMCVKKVCLLLTSDVVEVRVSNWMIGTQ